MYTKLWSAAAAANGVGPLLATIVFVATGNVWTRHSLEVREHQADRDHLSGLELTHTEFIWSKPGL